MKLGRLTQQPQGEYIAVKGFNWGPEDVRVEAGEIVRGLPADVIAALLEAEAIEPKGEKE